MSLEALSEALGHRFGRIEFLEAALVHRSHTAENPSESDNERMEFLGDAVLQLVVTDFLFERYPMMPEGEMAKVRAACVNRDELAVIARRIDVGPSLRLGIGEEQTGGRQKESILADAMEALIAAIYLDAGLEAARSSVLDLWNDLIVRKATQPGHRDYKTRLQELLAAEGKHPVYTVEGTGPDHAREFVAVVEIDGEPSGAGHGRSKKEAQQQAARAVLDARTA